MAANNIDNLPPNVKQQINAVRQQLEGKRVQESGVVSPTAGQPSDWKTTQSQLNPRTPAMAPEPAAPDPQAPTQRR